MSAVRWIGHGNAGTMLWAVVSGFAFVITTAVLSVLLARGVVAAAFRDQFTEKADVQLRTAGTVMLMTPWLFVVFAGVVISVAAFR